MLISSPPPFPSRSLDCTDLSCLDAILPSPVPSAKILLTPPSPVLHGILTVFYYSPCVCVCEQSLPSCSTLCDPMDCSLPGFSVHRDSWRKNTWVGCHALLQGISLTQGSNSSLSCLLHWQVGSSPPVPPGKPHYSPYQSLLHSCAHISALRSLFSLPFCNTILSNWQNPILFYFFFKGFLKTTYFYIFIWLCWVLVAAQRTFDLCCGMHEF